MHLPPFLVDELRARREHNPDAQFVFTGDHGGLHRRSNFRRRFWLPALAGDEQKGWSPLNEELHFHDLRHTHETWLVEDRVPRIVRLARLGAQAQGCRRSLLARHGSDDRGHAGGSAAAVGAGGWVDLGGTPALWSGKWRDLFGCGVVVGGHAPHLLPKITDGPPTKIVDGPQSPWSGAGVTFVGDTGIEPVTSSV